MRLVSHPNVVDLRAFFYSNGEKVGGDFSDLCLISRISVIVVGVSCCDVHFFRKMKSISTLYSNMSPKLFTAPAVIMRNSSNQCQCYKSNCICTNSCVRSPTSIRSGFVIVT